MTPLPAAFLDRPLTHRALHDKTDRRPENSRAAIRAAIAGNYGIEIDLQCSKDGQAMVFHDYELSRLTEAIGAVAQRSAAELANVKLKHSDEGIATLSEVLDIVAGQVPLLIEIKDQDGMFGKNTGPLGAATAAALARYTGPVALMSFNPHAVAEMADLAPGIARGLVTAAYKPADFATLPAALCDTLRAIPDYSRCRASFISHEAADLGRPIVQELKDRGAHVLCWTIRSPEAEAKAREIAENITFEGYLA